MEAQKKSRTDLILVVVAFIGTPLVVWILLNFFPDVLKGMGRSNFGTFVSPPVTVVTDGLLAFDKSDAKKAPTVDISQLKSRNIKGSWTYVTISPSKCDVICLRNIQYQLRVRIIQGRESHQVRVLYVVTDTLHLSALLAESHKYPNLEYAYIKPENKASFIAGFKIKAGDQPLNQQRIYLVDRRGQLMMYYEPNRGDPKDLKIPTGMRKDMNRLIKTNNIPNTLPIATSPEK